MAAGIAATGTRLGCRQTELGDPPLVRVAAAHARVRRRRGQAARRRRRRRCDGFGVSVGVLPGDGLGPLDDVGGLVPGGEVGR